MLDTVAHIAHTKMADEFVNITCKTLKKVLVVGLTTIDVINFCDHYPKEDEDIRAISQRWATGGNAANTARVLSQHKNMEIDLYSNLSSKSENSFVIKELEQSNVNLHLCKFYEDYHFPMASCIVNKQNGSRTILSCNKFPPLDSKTFIEQIDILRYDLIHFEGRDLDDVSKMIDHVIETRKALDKPLISGEMEKPKRLYELEMHIQPKVDILFVNKDIAQSKGFKDSMETVKSLSNMNLNARYAICPWSDKGAALAEFLLTENLWKFKNIPAFPLDNPVDTLGAGDTFIGGVIYGLLAINDAEKAVKYGCYLAKQKCETIGFQNLLDEE